MKNLFLTLFVFVLITNVFAKDNLVCGIYQSEAGNIFSKGPAEKIVFDLKADLDSVDTIDSDGLFYKQQSVALENGTFDVTLKGDINHENYQYVELTFSSAKGYSESTTSKSMVLKMEEDDSIAITSYDDGNDGSHSDGKNNEMIAICYKRENSTLGPWEDQPVDSTVSESTDEKSTDLFESFIESIESQQDYRQ